MPAEEVSYPAFPTPIAPNPELPALIAELPEDVVLSGNGKARAYSTNETEITVENSSGTHDLVDLTEQVDKVLAVSEDAVFYQSGDKLFRVNISDSTITEITDAENYTENTIKTDINGNLLYWNGSVIYGLESGADQPEKISDVANDIRIQSDLLAFVNNSNQVEYLDLSDKLNQGNVKTLPADQAVDDYAIATDGSAITYKSGKDLFVYYENKKYHLSEDCSGFFLTDNPQIIAVLKNDTKVEVYQIGDPFEIISSHENVDNSTFYDNQTINYGGNYLYGNSSSLNF